LGFILQPNLLKSTIGGVIVLVVRITNRDTRRVGSPSSTAVPEDMSANFVILR
jgi:hypothetical protein